MADKVSKQKQNKQTNKQTKYIKAVKETFSFKAPDRLCPQIHFSKLSVDLDQSFINAVCFRWLQDPLIHLF